MNWKELDWRHCGRPAKEERIREIEAKLNVSFPKAFRECITHCQGGTPRRNAFWVADQRIGRFVSGVGAMLNLRERDPDGILGAMRDLGSQLPSGLVPFADDGGGDLVCLDYRDQTTPEPTVVYWQHEDQVVKLAANFEEFVSMLFDRELPGSEETIDR